MGVRSSKAQSFLGYFLVSGQWVSILRDLQMQKARRAPQGTSFLVKGLWVSILQNLQMQKSTEDPGSDTHMFVLLTSMLVASGLSVENSDLWLWVSCEPCSEQEAYCPESLLKVSMAVHVCQWSPRPWGTHGDCACRLASLHWPHPFVSASQPGIRDQAPSH